ncbi:hypothetical protein EYW49_19645 [Siculibacillus lacustris]|uniref:Uncharacterized protein n=1 Tax=Siculibacillus lacustris TaxID=1549641 RepID=A0A4Q9VFK1_9HYPH|nr:hypothetical protein [Siculibacillus lacustris]TBW33695.1 hypothetical protein EYW49_19645 [Siculibacillus lacustris]
MAAVVARNGRNGGRRGGLVGLALAVLVGFGGAATAGEPITVDVHNRSVRTACAEEDNVYYTLSSPDIGGFTIEARSPDYVAGLVRDRTAPDFSGCNFGGSSGADGGHYTPPTGTLWENDDFVLKGVVYPDFWRPTEVPVSVGKLTQKFLHLVQLWRKTPAGPVEFLVFYPQDGYWRLKGLPPARTREVAYGSSFLIGPVEESTRPYVAYKSVRFEPATTSFTLEFARGGTAWIEVTGVDVGRSTVAVTFDGVDTANLPFAGLRSMYVAPGNADTAETVVRATPGAAPTSIAVVDFKDAKAADVTFARSVPSSHNTSAPDLGFRDFRGR